MKWPIEPPQAGAELQLRLARTEDAGAIEAVLKAAFEQLAPFAPDDLSAAFTPATVILARLDKGPMWVAAFGDRIVGTVSAVVETSGLYVRSMAVLPEAQGRGIGALLLERAEAFALRRGCKRIFLTTRSFMPAAIRVYEHAGFRRSSEPPHPGTEAPTAFTMVKQLLAT